MMKNLLAILLLATAAFAQRELGVRPTETGGPLRFEQAVFDVQSYDVSLNVNIAAKSISGTTVMVAKTVVPTNVIQLDLDTPYSISKLTVDGKDAKYKFDAGKIWIWFPQTKQVGDMITTSITYSGIPKVAPRAPWIGGIMWEKTPSGADWVSVALQNDGADLLFPCKDHPSDKPSSAAMHITVPDPLVATGPGRLQGSKKNTDGTTTWNWLMTNQISNYSIVFNAAPYKLVKDTYKSAISGTMPIEFYVLPESESKAAGLIAEQKKYIAFFEKYNGPFPFRSQRVGIVETPHLGMEHSTNIAYGNQFKYNKDGTDWLLLHEFGHEYWANLVTASDWRDFWIHEGFQSYMDTLYEEHLHGKDAYMKAMKARSRGFKNKQAVAPREPKIAYQVYMSEPDYLNSDGDIYGKGAYFLHTLRYYIGDEAFFKALRHMAYPTKEHEKLTDGRQQRLVNTDDFLTIAEADSGMKLEWLFEMYLRQPKLPKLRVDAPADCVTNCVLRLTWDTPNNMPFPMPVDAVKDGKVTRVEMKEGRGTFTYSGAPPQIDPDGWILKVQ
ncbi:MAG TPA: M1 family metallopeptidase [Pyrinomonadaceae bacterium]|nr:M1 family metallopeptidase [Pyrinomonadaceae bacterium]